jgi:hypothetical protein
VAQASRGGGLLAMDPYREILPGDEWKVTMCKFTLTFPSHP